MSSSQNDSAIDSAPSSPACTNSLGKSPFKSVSLDWTNRAKKSQLTPDISTSNLSINTTQFMRSNRSVSPDHSRSVGVTRKITNYPDPTPGFMLKSSSRQSSTESVSKDSNDYSARSFTLPGLRNIHSASRISPARQKFFESSPTDGRSPMKLDESNAEEKTILLMVPPSPTNYNKQAETLSSKKTNKVIEDVKQEQSQPMKPMGVDFSKKQNVVFEEIKPEKILPTKIEISDSSKKTNKVIEEIKPLKSLPAKTDIADSSKKTNKVIEVIKPQQSLPTKTEPEIVTPVIETKPDLTTTSDSKKSDPLVKPVKSKSTSIAPSILQLRMKFAQKTSNSTSNDSSSSQKT